MDTDAALAEVEKAKTAWFEVARDNGKPATNPVIAL
jgi:hypothetical protein